MLHRNLIYTERGDQSVWRRRARTGKCQASLKGEILLRLLEAVCRASGNVLQRRATETLRIKKKKKGIMRHFGPKKKEVNLI